MKALYRRIRIEERDASSSTPTTMGDPKHVDEEKPPDEKLPSVVTDAERGALAKNTESKKGIIDSQPRRNDNVFTDYPKDPSCEVCKKTKTIRASCKIKPKKRKFGDLITPDQTILNVENESRCGHTDAPIVQGGIQRYQKKRKEIPQTMSCLQRFLPPSKMLERILHRQLKRVY